MKQGEEADALVPFNCARYKAQLLRIQSSIEIMPKQKKVSGISVVVPCYRSAHSLPGLIERIQPMLCKLADEYEVILVCDRCPHNTWETILDLSAKYDFVRGFELAKNAGQQVAVMAGLEMISYDYVVTTDDDLQHPPEEIEAMLDLLLESDLDVVIASLRSKKHGFVRNTGTWVTRYIVQSALNLKKPIRFSSFRVFRRWVADAAVQMNMPKPVVGYALLTATDRVANHEIEHANRIDGGRSGYSFAYLVKYFTSIMFSYSILPMQVVSVVGFVGAILALMIAIVYLALALLGLAGGNGFITLIVVLSLFFGLLLASIGVLGQYVMFLIKVAAGDQKFYVRNNAGSIASKSKKSDVEELLDANS